jgi:hypothetical protein
LNEALRVHHTNAARGVDVGDDYGRKTEGDEYEYTRTPYGA